MTYESIITADSVVVVLAIAFVCSIVTSVFEFAFRTERIGEDD